MLEVKNLVAKREEFYLKDVSFTVQDGEYFVLLGPTGAGKTVLLESIAGITGIRGGQIWINGKDVTSLTVLERQIGFAFQKYALYRHMPVRDNISFGLTWRFKSQKEIDKAIDQVIELLHLQNLLDKRPWALSGGESQKICLARAIAIRPDLLILDEPLGSVDPESREITERELKDTHTRLGLTTIHVTHDFEEAIALGDRVAVMIDGSIMQVGTPDEVFRHPNSEAVARFLMTRNIFDGEVQDGPDGQSAFSLDGKNLTVNTALRGRRHASVRPEDITILVDAPDSDNDNTLQGTITRISDRGSIAYVWVDVPPEFTCLVLHPLLEAMGLKEGQPISIRFNASAVNVF
ncbi:MAG: ABC transporter ATP-binding protein [Dehalococcoidales bacterium]|nr:MAG: ABC transporter ATP-binding protein [Dehalococcoidales bacterium]